MYPDDIPDSREPQNFWMRDDEFALQVLCITIILTVAVIAVVAIGATVLL